MKQKVYTVVGAALVIVFMLNPETIHIALMIDGVGLEVIILLIQLQFIAMLEIIKERYIRPCIKFVKGFRSYSFFMPAWKEICNNPNAIGYALPSAASGMCLLVSLVMLYSGLSLII